MGRDACQLAADRYFAGEMSFADWMKVIDEDFAQEIKERMPRWIRKYKAEQVRRRRRRKVSS